MTKLLFVVNHAGFFVSHRLPIATAALSAGYDVHIATPQSKHVQLLRDAGLQWHEIPLRRSGTSPLGELRTLLSLIRLYRRLAPDVVHHVTSKPVLYGTTAARLARVPAVVNAVSGMGHIFTDGTLKSRLLSVCVSAGYRFALRHRAMRVIFQNEHDRSTFISKGWLSREQTVLIAGSGVDVQLFSPRERASNEQPVVLFPSRMLTTKGVVEFVEAARILRGRSIDARFVLVGEPDPDNPASIPEQTIRSWVDEGLVEYWGRRSDMAEVFAGADIVCLPSYREGMPKALIEAAATGLPIVTTDVPGCRDVVRHEEHGLLVPVRKSAELAAAIERLVMSAELRTSYGAAARLRAVSELSLDRVVAATLSLYGELSA